ncbi:MAG: flagellar biosynthesis repressor FlbT [Hyphomonas sp.]|nr:flagellar biosynthesis repressor FlbT [Hyphomonas sp.]
MSGLVLKIAPGERFIVNGAVLENGDRPARIRITDSNARVLRCRDALHPTDVNTPVKRVYYAIQLLITGDLKDTDTVPAIDAECVKLLDVFKVFDAELIPSLRSMLSRGNYYSALCHLRQILELEEELMTHASLRSGGAGNAKVA